MAFVNLYRFNREIASFAEEEVKAKVVLFIKKLAMDLLRGAVLKTPVDTGRCRGNWQVTIDVNPDGELEISDPSGNSTIEKGFAELANVKLGQTIFITNNVTYALYLEEGTPKMAGHAMLRLTIEELRTQFGA